MKYIAILQQEGAGCDFTIGCGIQVVQLIATQYDKAVEEMRNLFGIGMTTELHYDLNEIETVTLVGCASYELLDLYSWNTELRDVGTRRREEEEREQLARLYNKYGKPP